MTTVFQTNYDTMMGLAKKPGGGKEFFSWINASNGHFYGEINLAKRTVRILSNSDPVGVASDAMVFKSFGVAQASNIPCFFNDKDCPCR